MSNKKLAYQIIDTVLQAAQGYDTRVQAQSSVQGLTRFANSEIHQNVQEERTQVSITITQGKRRSDVSTDLYDQAGLEAAVQEAVANLSLLPEGEEQPPLVESPADLEVESFDQELADRFDAEGRARCVKECLDLLTPDYKAYGALTYNNVQLAIGNSRGIRRFAAQNAVEFTALVADEKGGSGFARSGGYQSEDVDVVGAFRTAYEKARLNQNPMDLEPGAYTVILEPLAVSNLLGYLSMGFSGKLVQDKTSFLTDRLGSQVFDEKLTIIDDHTDPHNLSLPFDFEGTPRQKVTLIENGVAKDLVYDLSSAKKAGVESTGHSVGWAGIGGMPLHLVITPGEQTLDEIIRHTDTGLLVTRFHYINPVNPRQGILTGLTRDGVFKIENGEIVGAVHNMRFTQNMLEAFNNIAAISSDRYPAPGFFGNFQVPAMKIHGFHFTGKTHAN